MSWNVNKGNNKKISYKRSGGSLLQFVGLSEAVRTFELLIKKNEEIAAAIPFLINVFNSNYYDAVESLTRTL